MKHDPATIITDMMNTQMQEHELYDYKTMNLFRWMGFSYKDDFISRLYTYYISIVRYQIDEDLRRRLRRHQYMGISYRTWRTTV